MSEYQLVKLPPHHNPETADRIASAPYNFVPLPEVVVRAAEAAAKLPDHSTYANQGYPNTGYFDVTLTVKSPLYVRCPLTRDEFDLDQQDKDRKGNQINPQTPYGDRIKNTPDFFYTRNAAQPVIPGSSLRGMLRSLLEIVSYGKMQWVTDKKLFFRTVDNTAVGDHYRDRMVGKVETGFLQRKGDSYIIRSCQMVRVNRQKLGNNLYDGQGPNMTPRWNGQPRQWMPVWAQLTAGSPTVEKVNYNLTPGCREGRLVISGNMQNKKKEFVFLLPAEDAEEIRVSEEMLARFHDDDQITQWQERAFPKDKPGHGCRERDGLLRKDLRSQGDPVFFLRENGELTFFGRAQMFRLPYTQRPLDLIPPDLRRPEDIDYAEAIFGFIGFIRRKEDFPTDSSIPPQGNKARAYASRVSVTDAIVTEAPPEDFWLSDKPFPPRILATPKPTAFQHYLVQTNDNSRRLKHYDSPSPQEKVLRGHKLYWHQGPRAKQDLDAASPPSDTSTQRTQFKPVKPGVKFKFRVYFENLSDRELGALCWTVHPLGNPDQDYCHHLGMGKPLGMGAVKLDATLYLTDRAIRYGSLFDGDNWQTGRDAGRSLSDRQTLEGLTGEFEQHILGVLNPNQPCTHLFGVKRVGMLLKMLEWPGLAPTQTRSLSLNEFRQRLVLPDPSAFGTLTGNAEPIGAASPKSVAGGGIVQIPLAPTEPPLEVGYTGTRRETVTFLTEVKNGRAQARTIQGEDVLCASIGYTFTERKQCRADVVYEAGKAVRATFKGWN